MPLQSTQNGKGDAPQCSVIIPVFNGLEWTRACLETLFADQSRAVFEVIVVDNGSSDGVEKWLQSQSHRIKLLRLEENLGFARANNLGAEQARGEFIVMLNNDTVPLSGWLDALVAAAKSLPEAMIVGAKLVYPMNGLVQHAGVVFSQSGNPCHLYEGFPEEHPAVNKARRFQAVTAACMLIRRKDYLKLGGFDEGFINGFEDIDLCFRAREAGGVVWLQPLSVVIHHAGQSSGRLEHESANAKRLYKKWRPKIIRDEVEFLKEDNYELVLSPTGSAVSLRPVGVDHAAILQKGKTHLKAARIAAAAKEFEACHLLNPACAASLAYLVEALNRLGDWERGQRMLMRLAALQPGADVLLKLAENALKLKNYPLAVQFAQGVVQALSQPERLTASGWTVMGDATLKMGDFDAADNAYDRALSIDAGSVRALVGKGTAALARKDHPVAVALFSRALQVEPHHARALTGKGLTCLALGEKSAATNLLYQALQMEPENEWILTTLLPVLTDSNRLQDAARCLDRYLDVYPDDVAMLLARAGIAYAAKEFRVSRMRLEMVKRINPNHDGIRELEEELNRTESNISPSTARVLV